MMATLQETQRRNEVAADFAAQSKQANTLVSQLVAAKDNLLLLRQAVIDEAQFTEADAAEVQAVVAALATRVSTEVLGG